MKKIKNIQTALMISQLVIIILMFIFASLPIFALFCIYVFILLGVAWTQGRMNQIAQSKVDDTIKAEEQRIKDLIEKQKNEYTKSN